MIFSSKSQLLAQDELETVLYMVRMPLDRYFQCLQVCAFPILYEGDMRTGSLDVGLRKVPIRILVRVNLSFHPTISKIVLRVY